MLEEINATNVLLKGNEAAGGLNQHRSTLPRPLPHQRPAQKTPPSGWSHYHNQGAFSITRSANSVITINDGEEKNSTG